MTEEQLLSSDYCWQCHYRIIRMLLIMAASTFSFFFVLSLTLSTIHSPQHQKQYVTKASSCLRAALKEPAKSKALAQESFSYNKSIWANGEQGVKTLTDSLAAVGK